MIEALVVGAAAVVLIGVAIWLGNRTLASTDKASAAMMDGIGGVFDVFDPSQARAKEDLKAQKTMPVPSPSPEDGELPVTVDLRGGTAKIRRPRI